MVEDHRVQFARRYAAESASTLSAYVAFYRCEMLIEDAVSLEEKVGSHGFPGHEISSYYAVAFVTCLEWHARSRLADLLRFEPKQLAEREVKVLNQAALVRAMVGNVPIPELIASLLHVSSADQYLGVFQRIFDATGASASAKSVVIKQALRTVGEGEFAHTFDAFERLFEYRNELVHEIHGGHVGRLSMRVTIPFSEAIVEGRMVLEVMRALEKQISKCAPPHFPDRFSEDGVPLPETEAMKAQIVEIERQLEKVFCECDGNVELWRDAVASANASIERHDQLFLRSQFFSGTMFERFQDALFRANYRSRLKFLQFVRDTARELDETIGSPN